MEVLVSPTASTAAADGVSIAVPTVVAEANLRVRLKVDDMIPLYLPALCTFKSHYNYHAYLHCKINGDEKDNDIRVQFICDEFCALRTTVRVSNGCAVPCCYILIYTTVFTTYDFDRKGVLWNSCSPLTSDLKDQ